MSDKQHILNSIAAIARGLGRAPSQSEFATLARISEHYVTKFFPSWNDAVRAAGRQPYTLNVRLDDSELLRRALVLAAGRLSQFRARQARMGRRPRAPANSRAKARIKSAQKANNKERPLSVPKSAGQSAALAAKRSCYLRQRHPLPRPPSRTSQRTGRGAPLRHVGKRTWLHGRSRSNRIPRLRGHAADRSTTLAACAYRI